MQIDEYWKLFLKEKGLASNTKYYEAFAFGMNAKANDELLDLVLKGKKIATTSPYFSNEEYPKIGDYSIVLDSKGIPHCIIQTVNYQILKFNEATFDLIKDEGEDKVLDTWIYNHRVFLREACKEKGVEFKDDMLIFFEHFTIIYE